MKLTKNVTISRKGYQPLPENILLKGGKVIDPLNKLDKAADVYINKGVIKEIPRNSASGYLALVILFGLLLLIAWLVYTAVNHETA